MESTILTLSRTVISLSWNHVLWLYFSFYVNFYLEQIFTYQLTTQCHSLVGNPGLTGDNGSRDSDQ